MLTRARAQPALLEVLIEPRSPGASDALGVGLACLAAAHPELCTRIEPESGLLLLGAASEAELEALVDELVEVHGVPCDVGAPAVAYRETIGRRAEIDYTHRKHISGETQFARVVLAFEPAAAGAGFQVESRIDREASPAEFILAVMNGLDEAKESGLIAGFPVTDVKAMLVEVEYHERHSTPLAFELAAWAAFRQLREKGAPRLLEPVMTVEATTPARFVKEVVGDLERREARILAVDGDRHRTVRALAPLAGLFGYHETLAALTRGAARAAVSFARYAPSPFSVDEQSLLDQAEARRA